MRIHHARNSVEAHLLVEALAQEGIDAFAESLPPGLGSPEGTAVSIRNPADEARARELVKEILRSDAPRPQRTQVFWVGLLLGLALGIGAALVGARVYEETQRPRSETVAWDANGDGAVDSWATFSADGRYVSYSLDRNGDGRVDQWQDFDPPGELVASRNDEDFDGEPDYWETVKDGVSTSYEADNDRDGDVDEWGRFEKGALVERRWSFQNDRVADKRAVYRRGRRIFEEHDRDRDGRFDERILLDVFERPIGSERLD